MSITLSLHKLPCWANESAKDVPGSKAKTTYGLKNTYSLSPPINLQAEETTLISLS